MNYIKNLLISDLIMLYSKTKDTKYIEDLKNRFKFCGFTNEETEEFIEFETSLYEFKGCKDDKTIIKRHYILGNKNKGVLFEDKSLYKYIPDTSSKKIFYTSELISVIDEAAVLTYSSNINKYKAKDKIIALSKEEVNNWVYREFFNRLEYLCRCANEVFSESKKSLFQKKISNLYWNESKICIDARWDPKYISSRKFEPYSEEFK